MKKLFTMLAISAATLATYTASAGTPIYAAKASSQIKVTQPVEMSSSNHNLKSIVLVCDTLINETNLDTESVFQWQAPGVGYVSGNGAVSAGSTLYPQTAIGEKFNAPTAGFHVSAAAAFFAYMTINAGDSATKITAYIYDTTGTSLAFNEYAPGAVLDSASVTLQEIATYTGLGYPTLFTFTNQPPMSKSAFFVTVSLPQATGDTLVIATNQGTTGDGNGWLEVSASGQAIWLSYDSLTGSQTGAYIAVVVCEDTGTTGIKPISNVNNFSIYPNPSNGVFTASMHMSSASDVYMSITDMTGTKVYESTDNAVVSMNKPINLSNLASGVYIASVKTAEGTSVQRLVIK